MKKKLNKIFIEAELDDLLGLDQQTYIEKVFFDDEQISIGFGEIKFGDKEKHKLNEFVHNKLIENEFTGNVSYVITHMRNTQCLVNVQIYYQDWMDDIRYEYH